jgi:hypothetical protein
MRTRLLRAMAITCMGLFLATVPAWATPLQGGRAVASWLGEAGAWLGELLAGWRLAPAAGSGSPVAASGAGATCPAGECGDLGHEIDPDGASTSTSGTGQTDLGHEIDPDG